MPEKFEIKIYIFFSIPLLSEGGLFILVTLASLNFAIFLCDGVCYFLVKYDIQFLL